MKNIILIAPPAAGKGTLSQELSDNLGYLPLSTGDMLRDKAKIDNELKEKMKTGKLIDDETVFQALELKLDTIGDTPYILDGFPRTIKQAEMYDELLIKKNKDLGVVIYLDVDKDELLKRVTSRRICPKCKRTYSVSSKSLMPKEDGICDVCKEQLIQRDDDKEEIFNERYEEYLSKTSPLIDYYKNKDILYSINAVSHSDTYNEVIKIIK